MVRGQALPPVTGGVRVSPIGDRPLGMEVRRAIESQADKLQLSAAIDEAMAWLVAEEITSLADLSLLISPSEDEEANPSRSWLRCSPVPVFNIADRRLPGTSGKGVPVSQLAALLPVPGVQHRGSTVARDIW